MSTSTHYALAEGQAAAIAGIHAEYVRALRDANEAAAGFDAGYYQGRADAFVGALSVLGAFRESTCAGCGKSLLFTADGRWLDDGDSDQCDPQPGWAKIPHTPTAASSATETEKPEVVEAVRRAIAQSCGLNVIAETAEDAIAAYRKGVAG